MEEGREGDFFPTRRNSSVKNVVLEKYNCRKNNLLADRSQHKRYGGNSVPGTIFSQIMAGAHAKEQVSRDSN